MIIEFFGLSNSGKSVLKKALEKKEYVVYKTEETNFPRKLILFLRHFTKNPSKTLFLFYKLNSNNLPAKNFQQKLKSIIMRNSYLLASLGKYEAFKHKKEKIIVDEFSFQSIFMILQKKSNTKELKKIINKLPKSDILIVFEGNEELRKKAYQIAHPLRPGSTLLPGSFISKSYGLKWMETMEHNFSVIKKIIQKNHAQITLPKVISSEMKKVNNSFKKKNKLSGIELTLPKAYKIK